MPDVISTDRSLLSITRCLIVTTRCHIFINECLVSITRCLTFFASCLKKDWIFGATHSSFHGLSYESCASPSVLQFVSKAHLQILDFVLASAWIRVRQRQRFIPEVQRKDNHFSKSLACTTERSSP